MIQHLYINDLNINTKRKGFNDEKAQKKISHTCRIQQAALIQPAFKHTDTHSQNNGF